MHRLALLVCLCLSSSFASAQSSPEKSFEVASIRIHPFEQPGKIGFYGTAGGCVELGICKLDALVAYALDVDRQLIAGIPDWAAKVAYDINAVPPENSPSRKLNLSGFTATPTPEQREMILSLLIERFGFKYHVEQRDMPVYLLERGKGPLKLLPPEYPERAADPRGGLFVRGDIVSGEGRGQSMTLNFLARQLVWPLERPVINQTGIDGVYDFHIEPIDPENRDKVRAAMLMTQALGLKLTASHAPVRAIQIDAATPPTEN